MVETVARRAVSAAMGHRADGVLMTRRLSWDHEGGVAAALSREDAIDATAVSLTRRDGPDAVRNSSNSKKKRPPASCVRYEARRRRECTARRRDPTRATHEIIARHVIVFHNDL